MTDHTVMQAGGQNYAVRHTPAEIMSLASQAEWLELRDGNERMYIPAASIALLSVWTDLPPHHGRTWLVTDANRNDDHQPKAERSTGDRAASESTTQPKRRGRPPKTSETPA